MEQLDSRTSVIIQFTGARNLRISYSFSIMQESLSDTASSAYFELERTQNGNLQVRGKGYGHGVGMSQTGADKMAEQGYDYREILDYFFRNITVENLG